VLYDYEKSPVANDALVHGTRAKRSYPLRVLIADENRQFREFIRRRLEHEADFEVVGEVFSGSDFLPLARQVKPDVILVDIALSGMAGLEGARRIKTEMSSTAIIFLSVVEEDALRDAAARYGADDFLTKDVLTSELFSRIRRRAARATPGGY